MQLQASVVHKELYDLLKKEITTYNTNTTIVWYDHMIKDTGAKATGEVFLHRITQGEDSVVYELGIAINVGKIVKPKPDNETIIQLAEKVFTLIETTNEIALDQSLIDIQEIEFIYEDSVDVMVATIQYTHYKFY